MKDLRPLKKLVSEWTQKAQSRASSDDERSVYYDCAKTLHEVVQDLDE